MISRLPLIVSIVLSTMLQSNFAAAEFITEAQGVNCIVGEAKNKYSYSALLANAEALRSRGTTKGVYGCTTDYTRELMRTGKTEVIKNAKRAWEESKNKDNKKGK